MYSFIDAHDTFHVYKHHDGYPTGAAEAIQNAVAYAWQLPRFEADEFSAAFVAGNKSTGGGVRLMHSGEWRDVAPGDLEYRYEISKRDGDNELSVRCYSVHCDRNDKWSETELWFGPQRKFAAWAKKEETAQADA